MGYYEYMRAKNHLPEPANYLQWQRNTCHNITEELNDINDYVTRIIDFYEKKVTKLEDEIKTLKQEQAK